MRDSGAVEKGLSAFHQRGGQNDAGASDAAATVVDGHFCIGPDVGSQLGLLNSPTATYFVAVSGPPRFRPALDRHGASRMTAG
jgi:hypothetical protein